MINRVWNLVDTIATHDRQDHAIRWRVCSYLMTMIFLALSLLCKKWAFSLLSMICSPNVASIILILVFSLTLLVFTRFSIPVVFSLSLMVSSKHRKRWKAFQDQAKK